MGKIYLNTDAVYNLKSNMYSKRNSCRDCSSRVYSVQNNLYWKVLNRSRIRTRLNNLRSRINRQSELLYSYSQVLGTVNNNMTDTDNRLRNDAKRLTCQMSRITKVMSVCQNGSARSKKMWGLNAEDYSFITSLFGGGIGGASLSTKALTDGFKKWSWDSIKSAGYVGTVLGLGEGFISMVKGTSTPLSSAKTLRSAWKAIKNFDLDASNMGKVKRILHPDTYKVAWENKIFGIGNYFGKTTGAASKASSWSTRFYNNFQKAGTKELAKVGWTSVALSGVVNFFDNKEEYKTGEISKGRAVAETITETAVDVATDVVLTAGAAAAVGATAVALGATVAAPAVAVAAVTVGAKMALDGIALWATGGEKNFTEAASDAILDVGTAIGKGVVAGAKKVGSAISTALDSITPRWKFSFGF